MTRARRAPGRDEFAPRACVGFPRLVRRRGGEPFLARHLEQRERRFKDRLGGVPFHGVPYVRGWAVSAGTACAMARATAGLSVGFVAR